MNRMLWEKTDLGFQICLTIYAYSVSIYVLWNIVTVYS